MTRAKGFLIIGLLLCAAVAAWGAQITPAYIVDLATRVTGTLGIGNGGTGVTTCADNRVLTGGTTITCESTLTFDGNTLTATSSTPVIWQDTGGVEAGRFVASSKPSMVYRPGASGDHVWQNSAGTEIARLTNGLMLLFGADNTSDIGATGATRPRTVYLSGTLQGRMGTSTSEAPQIANANVNTTGVGNVGACGPDDLITYTFPANALSANGKGVRIRAWGTSANNANAKTVAMNWGSQAILSKILTVSVVGTWEFEALVFKTGSNTQDIYVTGNNNNGSAVASVDGATIVRQAAFVAGTQTDTANITIKGTCTTATSNNDVIQEGMFVEFVN